MGFNACKPLRADETQKIGRPTEKKSLLLRWLVSTNCSSLHYKTATLLKSGSQW